MPWQLISPGGFSWLLRMSVSVTRSCLTLDDPHGLWPARFPCPWGPSRQEHWSGLPFPSPGHLPDAGLEPASSVSPALVGRCFATSAAWKAPSGRGDPLQHAKICHGPKLPVALWPKINFLFHILWDFLENLLSQGNSTFFSWCLSDTTLLCYSLK